MKEVKAYIKKRVSDIETAVRISTGERGNAAV